MINLIWEDLTLYNRNNSNKDCLAFARMLNTDLASEISAITEYTYGSVVFNDCEEELSKLFGKIAATEMHHFRTLSELIFSLGGNPSLNTSLHTHHSDMGADCSHRQNGCVRRFLCDSIRDEISANARYLKLAECAPTECAADILRNIANDEAQHVKLLQSALTGYGRYGGCGGCGGCDEKTF